MSGLTKVKNYNTSISVINNKLATEETLKQLLSLTGTESEELGNITTEIETSNIKLDSIKTELDTANDYLEYLQRQDLGQTATDYNFDVWESVLVPNTPPVNPYLVDPFKRNAWYFTNTNTSLAGTSLYWFSSDAPFNFKSNSILTLGELTLTGSFYVALYIDKVSITAGLPIFAVYTTPTGSGDAVPSFYKSRKTYRPATSEQLYAGELIVVYNNPSILDEIKNVYPTARRVLLSESGSVGTCGESESIRFLSVNNDTGASALESQWALCGAGWFDGQDIIRHYKFSVSESPSGEQSVSDASTHTYLFNTNSKLDTLNTKITACNTSDISGNVNVSNQITGFALDSNLTTLNNKITACNTSDISGNVKTDQSTSSLLIYGFDGSGNKKILTDNDGRILANVDESTKITSIDNKLTTTNTLLGDLDDIKNNTSSTNTKLDTLNAKTINTSDISGNVNITNTSIDTRLYAFCSFDSTFHRLEVDHSSHSKLFVKDDDVFEKLDDIDGKITACNTDDISGNVNVSNQITGFATETTLSSIDTKLSITPIGDYLNVHNADLSGNSFSSSFNITNYKKSFLTISHTSTLISTPILVYITNDTTAEDVLGGVIYFQTFDSTNMVGYGNFDLTSFTSLRLYNPNNTKLDNVKASLYSY